MNNNLSNKEKFFKFSDIFYKMVILNFTILLYTLLGLVIFGIGPALRAGYYITSKWLKKEEPRFLETFHNQYKSNFFTANIAFLTFGIFISIFSFSIYIANEKITNQMLKYSTILSSFFFVILFLSALLFVYFFDSNYQIGIKKSMKYSLTIVWGKVGYLLTILFFTIVLFVITYFTYGAMVFIFFGLYIFNVSYYANIMFKNVIIS